MSNFRRTPGRKEEASVDSFIEQAGRTEPEPAPLPWLGLRSDKRTELFNLRLTESEMAKLRYIAEHTPDSMQTFCQKILLPAMEQKIAEILKQTPAL